MIIIILLNICRSDLQVFFPTSVTQSPAGLKGHVETSLETHLSLMAWGTQAYAYHLICWYIYKYKCIRNTHTRSQWWLVNRMMNAVAWRRPELQRFVFEISFSRWKHTPVAHQHAQSCTVSGKESSNRTSTAFTGSSGRLIFVETHFPFVISTGISVCVCVLGSVRRCRTHTYIHTRTFVWKLMLPLCVQPNQRCLQPCPNAALQTCLPVLPKTFPAREMSLIFLFCVFYFRSFIPFL